MDADVDAMPESRQARVGQYLKRTDSEGVKLLDGLDSEARNDFFGTPCTRLRLSAPVGAGVSQQPVAGAGMIAGCGDGISDDLRKHVTAVNSRSDSFDANQFIKNTDTASRNALEGVDDVTTRRLLVRYGDGDIDTENLREINEVLDDSDIEP